MPESSGFITLGDKDWLNAYHQWKDGEIVNTSEGPCEVRIDYNGGIELLQVTAHLAWCATSQGMPCDCGCENRRQKYEAQQDKV